MKKYTLKVLLIILIVTMIMGICGSVFAADLVNKIQSNTGTETAKTVGNVGGMIVGILQVIGVAVAIIMLVMLGIKYVSAAPSEKADIKKSAVIYIVGAVLLLGASLILGWIGNFIGDLQGANGGAGATPSARPNEDLVEMN